MSVEVMSGGGSANLQSKSILPSSLPYTASPDSGYDGFSSLTVQKPSLLLPENIRSGVSLFGVDGAAETLKFAQSSSTLHYKIDDEIWAAIPKSNGVAIEKIYGISVAYSSGDASILTYLTASTSSSNGFAINPEDNKKKTFATSLWCTFGTTQQLQSIIYFARLGSEVIFTVYTGTSARLNGSGNTISVVYS